MPVLQVQRAQLERSWPRAQNYTYHRESRSNHPECLPWRRHCSGLHKSLLQPIQGLEGVSDTKGPTSNAGCDIGQWV